MRRREFMTLLGGAAAWPVAARAQPLSMPVVGFLNGGSRSNYTRYLAAFHQGLKEAGFTEGLNVQVEYRWADGEYARLPDFAADLVRRQVSVIAAAAGMPSVLAARAATSRTPIVFRVGGDPVASGIVTNLARRKATSPA